MTEIWHCIFCGRHGDKEYFWQGETKVYACPYCREYKGLEPCNPETCEFWTLDVVRKLAETDAVKKLLWKEDVQCVE